jgi:hypothetical protein
MAVAKDKPVAHYQPAVFQDSHTETVRMNCYQPGDSSMSTCHDAQVLVYTVKVGGEVYTLTPYNTRPHRESLYRQPAGSAAAAWNDGSRVHVRIAGKDSPYDIVGESADDATR